MIKELENAPPEPREPAAREAAPCEEHQIPVDECLPCALARATEYYNAWEQANASSNLWEWHAKERGKQIVELSASLLQARAENETLRTVAAWFKRYWVEIDHAGIYDRYLIKELLASTSAPEGTV